LDEAPPPDPKEEPPPPRRLRIFEGRPVVEIMTILFTLVVCFMVVVSGVTILIVKAFNPGANTTELLGVIGNILTTMTAALLGLVAGQGVGKSDR
jgi:hypothetical protein